MTGTFWAILPPVIAIVLALITKEVYLSLMIGIASGALMYHNFHLIKAMDTNQVLPEPMENGQQKRSVQRDRHFLQRSVLEL